MSCASNWKNLLYNQCPLIPKCVIEDPWECLQLIENVFWPLMTLTSPLALEGKNMLFNSNYSFGYEEEVKKFMTILRYKSSKIYDDSYSFYTTLGNYVNQAKLWKLYWQSGPQCSRGNKYSQSSKTCFILLF